MKKENRKKNSANQITVQPPCNLKYSFTIILNFLSERDLPSFFFLTNSYFKGMKWKIYKLAYWTVAIHDIRKKYIYVDIQTHRPLKNKKNLKLIIK